MARSDDWLGIALPAAIAAVGLGGAVCAGLALSVIGTSGAFDDLSAWWSAPPAWEPRFAVDPAMTGGIDHAGLHEKLLPTWVIAGGYRGSPAGDAAYAEATTAVLSAIAPDPNLTALFQDLDAGVRAGPVSDPERLLQRSAAWSRYLAERGVPWRVHGTVRGVGEGGSFTLKTYHVLAAFEARIDDEARGPSTAHVEIVTRTDGLNVVEGYLGAVTDGEDGARVIVDRLETFALDALWPLFDGAPSGGGSALASAVVAEASAAMPADAVAALRATAADRRRIVAAVAAIRERRGCGGRFVINRVPWDGFGAEDDLAEVAARDSGQACPGVTVNEAALIDAASSEIRQTPGVIEALEALVAFAARPTVIHEVRHVADGGYGADVACVTDCESLPLEARAELSAYLASFAAPGSSATALVQACGQRELGGAHGAALQAISFVASACEEGLPELSAAARAEEAAFFGRKASISLPPEMPGRLPLREGE